MNEEGIIRAINKLSENLNDFKEETRNKFKEQELKAEFTTTRIDKIEKIQKYDEETRMNFFEDFSQGLKKAVEKLNN